MRKLYWLDDEAAARIEPHLPRGRRGARRVDNHGRPRVLLLSAGNTNDITMADALIEAAGPIRKLLADRGYDADHRRKRLAERSAAAVIPTTTSRKRLFPYDVVAYRQRNTVERLRALLKDYRRVATRYDKLAANYLSGVLIAPTVCYRAK